MIKILSDKPKILQGILGVAVDKYSTEAVLAVKSSKQERLNADFIGFMSALLPEFESK